MLHGGAPAGLIARRVEELPSRVPMRVTRLTIDLQRPVPIGPLEVSAEVTREGRNIQTSQITLSANGKTVVRASALRVRAAELDLPAEAALPPAPGPVPQASGGEPGFRPEGFNNAVIMREAEAGDLRGAAKAVWFRIERPFFSDRETSPLMRAAATGDYCNGFGSPLDFEQWTYINADLTLHFARAPVGEWIMLAARCWIGPDGRAVAHGDLADQDGYFGRAAQSLVIARR
ncbi:MAG: thioesterase family protein [Alphaproteobacteria bacterium]|jgi:hypothetical protein|nr:thioesterase family protein [Alphaproteobacteria bacterium]